MAVSGKNVNQINFFSTLTLLVYPRRWHGHLQKMALCNFYLNTWRQIQFQRNCSDKTKPNYLTFGRAVPGLNNVDEAKHSSTLTLCRVKTMKIKQ